MTQLSRVTPTDEPSAHLAGEDTGFPAEEPVEEQPPPEDQDTDFPTPGDGP